MGANEFRYELCRLGLAGSASALGHDGHELTSRIGSGDGWEVTCEEFAPMLLEKAQRIDQSLHGFLQTFLLIKIVVSETDGFLQMK